ncbi:hypothetical protein [Pareuzebyella sediminis]|jgi:hypothetical protein|uniref:hypothetical protein n=1 Tax=Pareuzebyella sediminis TaxID=2607998 RepID=UPI0011EBD5C3|nr:hypothetical protein [Pareuzebyella sediminis]
MKQVVILCVSLAMLVKPLWPIVEYIVNYDYIVNVLCENKDRPELQCDGKCYLAKQLAKETKNSEDNPFGEKRSKLESIHLVFFEVLAPIDFTLTVFDKKRNNFPGVSGLISSLLFSDFGKPPELS